MPAAASAAPPGRCGEKSSRGAGRGSARGGHGTERDAAGWDAVRWDGEGARAAPPRAGCGRSSASPRSPAVTASPPLRKVAGESGGRDSQPLRWAQSPVRRCCRRAGAALLLRLGCAVPPLQPPAAARSHGALSPQRSLQDAQSFGSVRGILAKLCLLYYLCPGMVSDPSSPGLPLREVVQRLG